MKVLCLHITAGGKGVRPRSVPLHILLCTTVVPFLSFCLYKTARRFLSEKGKEATGSAQKLAFLLANIGCNGVRLGSDLVCYLILICFV